MSRAKRYIRNVLWSWAGVATTILLGFLLSPYTIRKIGEVNFSIWTLALSLVEYYWLIDFGFRSSTVRFSAESLAKGDQARLNELVSAGVMWSTAAGIVTMATPVDGGFRINGKGVLQGSDNAPYVQEHTDLVASIRAGDPLNELVQVAESTLTAIMGRMAAYTGKTVTWDEALNSPMDTFPKKLSWDMSLQVSPTPVPGRRA